MAEDWRNSTFVPLFKKGDPAVCSNNRTISLLSHLSKILLKILLERMRAKVEFELYVTQAGFRPAQRTTTHIYNLHLITERARSHQQPLYMCFVDFEKAFDTIYHEKLRQTLGNMGFPQHTVALIGSLYEGQRSNVRTNGRCSEWFAVLRGIRQECNVSPYLLTYWLRRSCA